MSFRDLIVSSKGALFIVGSAKSAGKTVALNRIRREAYLHNRNLKFGLMSIGWDGEKSDHLTGKEKPLVEVHEGDVVMTASSVMENTGTKLDVLWSSSYCGRVGRLLIGEVTRSGNIELVGASSVHETAKAIKRISEEKVDKLIIDGAANRLTQLAADFDSEVALVYKPKSHDTIDSFAKRIEDDLLKYELPITKLTDLPDLDGNQLALSNGNCWKLLKYSDLSAEKQENIEKAVLGGPITDKLLKELLQIECVEIVVEDPTKVHLSDMQMKKHKDKLSVKARFNIVYLGVKSFESGAFSFSPNNLLQKLQKKFPEFCVFDAWLVE